MICLLFNAGACLQLQQLKPEDETLPLMFGHPGVQTMAAKPGKAKQPSSQVDRAPTEASEPNNKSSANIVIINNGPSALIAFADYIAG